MEIRYNVTGDRRKALVQAISNITGARAVYKFMPTCNYEIDIFTVTKDGTLIFDDRSDSEEVEKVLDGIAAAGFECEAAQDADSWDTAAFAGDAGELPAEEPEAALDADIGDTAAPAEDVGELPTEEMDAAQDADSGDTAAFAGDDEELPTEEPEATQGADEADTAAPNEDAGEMPTEEPEATQGADSGDTEAPAGDAGETLTEEPEAAQDADNGDTAAFAGDAGELPNEERDAAQDADSGDTEAPAEDAEELPTQEPDAAQDAESGDTAAFAENAGELLTKEPEATQDMDSGEMAAFAEDVGMLPTEELNATQGADEADTAAPAGDAGDAEEPGAAQDADNAEDTGLTVSLPMDGFTEDALDRLRKLVDSKAKLIRKALGTVRLEIRTDAERVSFPWWDTLPEPEETQAFTAFIAALCAMAKTSKRVTAIEKDVETEKYAFRGFLLRLGFIGAGCKDQRKLLLKNLSGTSAFPNKEKADAFSAAQKAKRNAAKSGTKAMESNSTPLGPEPIDHSRAIVLPDGMDPELADTMMDAALIHQINASEVTA